MCLSKNYKDIYSRLKFKCVNNHIWSTTARNVIRGSWCNKCHFYYSEEICRTTFQQIFKKKFPKSRPSWLIGAKGYTMELDGYNEKLRVAFEYQGEQHFKKDDYFTGKNLKDIILSDKLKANLCASKKVNLIIITYKDDLIDLPKKIKKNINRNLNIYKNLDFDKNIDFNKIYSHKPKILVLKSFAKKLGGKCLSNKYVNNRTYMKWECAEGHQWPAPSSRILYGKWCRKCFLEKRKKI